MGGNKAFGQRKLPKQWYSIRECAEICGVTRGRIQQLISEGYFKGCQLRTNVDLPDDRGYWMIPASEVERYRDLPPLGRPRSLRG